MSDKDEDELIARAQALSELMTLEEAQTLVEIHRTVCALTRIAGATVPSDLLGSLLQVGEWFLLQVEDGGGVEEVASAFRDALELAETTTPTPITRH